MMLCGGLTGLVFDQEYALLTPLGWSFFILGILLICLALVIISLKPDPAPDNELLDPDKKHLEEVTQLTADSIGGRKAYVSNGEDVKEDTKRGAIFVDSAELTRRGSGRLSASLEMMMGNQK